MLPEAAPCGVVLSLHLLYEDDQGELHKESTDNQGGALELGQVDVHFMLMQPLEVRILHAFNFVPGNCATKMNHAR